MSDFQDEKTIELDNFSQGQQNQTTRFQKREGDSEVAQNTDFSEVGGVGKKLGYAQRASALTSTSSTSTSTTTTSTSTSTSSSTTTTSTTS